MKNIFMIILIVLIGSCQAPQLHIHVSPMGEEQNQGTADAPLLTLNNALEMAAKWKSQNPDGAITISLREGIHYLNEPVRISADLSGTEKAPFTIRAYPGEKVTISGAMELDLSWENAENGLLKASVMNLPGFDQLYINGKKQIRARYPNYDPDILVYNGFAADAISPERIKSWNKPETGVVHAMHRAEWGDYHYQITGVDDNGEAILEGGFQNNRQMGMHKDYRFVENIREELDAPGEWYYDDDEKLLYYLPETGFDLNTSLVEVAVLENLMEIQW